MNAHRGTVLAHGEITKTASSCLSLQPVPTFFPSKRTHLAQLLVAPGSIDAEGGAYEGLCAGRDHMDKGGARERGKEGSNARTRLVRCLSSPTHLDLWCHVAILQAHRYRMEGAEMFSWGCGIHSAAVASSTLLAFAQTHTSRTTGCEMLPCWMEPP